MMNFFKKRFQRKNAGANEQNDDTFTILQLPEGVYDQQQVGQCHNQPRKANQQDCDDCEGHCQSNSKEDAAFGCEGKPVGALGEISNNESNYGASNALPTVDCHYSPSESLQEEHNNRLVPTFRSVGKGNKEPSLCRIGSVDIDCELKPSSCEFNDDELCTCHLLHGCPGRVEVVPKNAASPHLFCEHSPVEQCSNSMDTPNYKPLASAGSRKEDHLQSSGSLSTDGSSSVSSRDSETHGSYTLWPEVDDKELSCSDNYFTPESTMVRHSCSPENLNSELVMYGLQSELVPPHRDLSLPKIAGLSQLECEEIALSSDHVGSEVAAETRAILPVVEDNKILIEEAEAYFSMNSMNGQDQGFAHPFDQEKGSSEEKEAVSSSAGFVTSSPNKRIHPEKYCIDDVKDVAGSTLDSLHPESDYGASPQSQAQPQKDQSSNVTASAPNGILGWSREIDGIHDISYIGSVPEMLAPTGMRIDGHSHVFDKFATPSDRTAETPEMSSERNSSTRDLDRSTDLVSTRSEYDTCTSTLDGYLIYDGSMGEGNSDRVNLGDSMDITNGLAKNSGGVTEKAPLEVDDGTNLRGEEIIPNCPMCGGIATFDCGIVTERHRYRKFKAKLKLLREKNVDLEIAGTADMTHEQDLSPLMKDADGPGIPDGKHGHKKMAGVSSDSKPGPGSFFSRGTGQGTSTSRRRHVAEMLANNAAAIILLLDHKMCERRWAFSSGEGEEGRGTSQILPDGFSYGEAGERRLSSDTDCRMDDSLCIRKEKVKLQHRRSRSFGSSVSRAITDAVNKLEEISHESRNKQYHKLFKFVPEDEGLIVSFSCALVRDILLQGRLYLSENWVGFHSNIFTFETQVAVPMEEILNITKERTAFVVPNAIGIHTNSNKYIFGSLLSRHSTYKQLVKVWNKREMLDETTSQESGSRMDSERDALDLDEIPTEEGEDADIEEEDADSGLVLAIDCHESQLQCDVHAHPHHPAFQERSAPCRRVSSTTKQIKPSRVQFLLEQILSLIQAVLAISIYKSLRRFIRHQPFLALSVLMFFILSTSALVLSYKIVTFQSVDLFHESYHKLSSLGNVLLSHHQSKHEKVRKLQDKLAHQLESMVSHQSDLSSMIEDDIS